VEAQDLGPLFAHPTEATYLWMVAIAIAVPTMAIAAWGLIRGRLGTTLAVNGLIVLPAFAFLVGNLVVMEESKSVEFCGSCHETMGPITESAFEDNGSLASIHFRAGAVQSTTGCFQCHSGYGMWGGVDAKIAGVNHMVHTVTGRYEYPLVMRAPFNIGSCLECHAESPKFREQVAHQDEAIQTALLSGEMSCAGMCHAVAHPEDALMGAAQ
jgi:nitrate/TMAO reductase-like tetraheme cytochrome c subunit